MKWITRFALMSCCVIVSNHAYKLPVDLFTQKTMEQIGLKPNAKIGLITNQSACDSSGRSALDVLMARHINIVMLLAAEHGVDGTVKAGESIAHAHHCRYNLPIISLYQQHTKEVPEHIMSKVDAFIFDMQDVGMRHFTYSATLLKLLQACAKTHKKLIVFDRPNPLGMLVEGPIAQSTSFLSSVPVAVRHGMTLGELALYCNKYVLDQKADLYVAPINRYKRTDEWKTLFNPLSPNIKSLQAAKGYSFLGLLGEIKPFDVGIGTEKPFQRIGLPKELLSERAWQQIAEILLRKGVLAHAICYERRGIAHRGLDLLYGDSNQLYGFEALLALLEFCKKEAVVLEESNYFAAAAGSSIINEYLHNKISYENLVKMVREQHETFLTRLRSIALYEPLPLSRWCSITQPTSSWPS